MSFGTHGTGRKTYITHTSHERRAGPRFGELNEWSEWWCASPLLPSQVSIVAYLYHLGTNMIGAGRRRRGRGRHQPRRRKFDSRHLMKVVSFWQEDSLIAHWIANRVEAVRKKRTFFRENRTVRGSNDWMDERWIEERNEWCSEIRLGPSATGTVCWLPVLFLACLMWGFKID